MSGKLHCLACVYLHVVVVTKWVGLWKPDQMYRQTIGTLHS